MELFEIARISNIPITTSSRLYSCIIENDHERLEQMVDSPFSLGRRHVIFDGDACTINERIKFAGRRGFSMCMNSVKILLARDVADGIPGWQKSLPSDNAVRAYRALFRDVACETLYNKKAAKCAAESCEHVEFFFACKQELENAHPGTMRSPRAVWNYD